MVSLGSLVHVCLYGLRFNFFSTKPNDQLERTSLKSAVCD